MQSDFFAPWERGHPARTVLTIRFKEAGWKPALPGFRRLALALLCAAALLADGPAPPKTKTESVTEVLHGVELADPYRWLENQTSPETRAWIDAQNSHTQSLLSAVPGQEALARRLTELMKIDVMGAPTVREGRYFFTKRLASQDLPLLYIRKGLEGKDEVLIDPHPLSADKRTTVNFAGISRDGTLMAYAIRQGGEDEVTIHLMEVDSRKTLPDKLPRGRWGGISFLPDKRGFYYSRNGPPGPRIFFHTIGADPAKDPEIFGTGLGVDKLVFGRVSESGRYLLLTVSHGSAGKTELYYQDLVRKSAIQPLVTDVDAHFYGQFGGDRVFIQTDWKAPRGRIMMVDLKEPSRDNWREVVPESDSVIQGVSLAGGRLCVNYTVNAITRIKIMEADGRRVRDIEFPAIGSGGIGGRWESNEAFYSFASFHMPASIYRYDVAKGTSTLWSRSNAPVDTSRFEVKQVWYESKDKTRVPMFLLHAKGIKLDGSNHTLLTGYGGFTASQTPFFSARAMLWAESGGVFALPNLRGGAEFGEEWHKAGMLDKKQNVFDDFIAAAEWLIKNGYTRPSKLAISGGSNGGLLVGAGLTQRPDLFQAVVCSYPLLDMVRYHKFLVARFWIPEYGSSDNAEQFRYLHAYSPYHRVKAGTKYPAVLFVTGDFDTRVDPLHARKMAALLQASTGSDRPVLLHYDTKAGHSGGRPLSQQIDVLKDELAFLFWQLGVEPGSAGVPPASLLKENQNVR